MLRDEQAPALLYVCKVTQASQILMLLGLEYWHDIQYVAFLIFIKILQSFSETCPIDITLPSLSNCIKSFLNKTLNIIELSR